MDGVESVKNDIQRCRCKLSRMLVESQQWGGRNLR